jgi:uncharacterized protein (DUF58 family)
MAHELALMTPSLTLDPNLLGALDDIALVARNVVEGFLSGLHHSPFLGYSTEFASYRQYMRGDNLRYVDWKVWGRTDKLYVKQFEDDTNLACQILLDSSASMDFGKSNKFHYGRVLAAALAYLMVRQHDAAGLALFGERTVQALPARGGRHHVDEVFQLLAGTAAQGQTSLGDDLWHVVDTFNRRGLAVIISDLFASGETMFQLFQQLHYRRQEIIVFHIMSAEELDFDYEGECLFEDAETGEELPVHAGSFRKEYLARVGQFRRRMENECEKYEMDYLPLRTDAPLDKALSVYLEKRLAV